MPKAYENIRDSLVAKGMPLAEAKTHAAKIYNSKRGHAPPVTNKSDEKPVRVGVRVKKG